MFPRVKTKRTAYMFRNKKYIEAFSKACQSNQPSSVHEARQILIVSSQAQLPAKHLITSTDGSCKPLESVCMCINVVKKARYWRTQDDIDVKAAKMAKAEVLQQKCDEKTKLPKRIQDIFTTYGDDVKVLRQQLMNMKGATLSAIHFFTWEGKPRNAREIAHALCFYTPNPSNLKNIVFLLVAAAGLGVAAGLAVSAGLADVARERERESEREYVAPEGENPYQAPEEPIWRRYANMSPQPHR